MDAEIYDWFATHEAEDRSDHCLAERGAPFTVVPPSGSAEAVLFCTKRCLFTYAYEIANNACFGLVARTGLLSGEDEDWLGEFAGGRRLLFFGDADPVDLLLYASMRSSLDIEHCGLNDRLLAAAGALQTDDLTIPLASNEADAMPLVRNRLGDLPSLLGPWCAGMLSSGRKIEIEAMFSFATAPRRTIFDAMLAKTEVR